LFVTRLFARYSRIAAVATLVLALGVAACGRKGPLDLPPGATTPAATPAPEDVLKFGSTTGGPASGAHTD
jgi:predicted small lipoprotein YifL